ncbi:threonine--tRNA ligase, mitochondrial 1-like [Cicer arietinum]|uniref:threonine--tRNA ligase, mitochondrial 1-like n=1 Tax=Cicer arietinum TaxID=3827 RepID=UPI003CC67F81
MIFKLLFFSLLLLSKITQLQQVRYCHRYCFRQLFRKRPLHQLRIFQIGHTAKHVVESHHTRTWALASTAQQIHALPLFTTTNGACGSCKPSTSLIQHFTKHFYSSSSTAASVVVVHAKDEPYLAATIPKCVHIFKLIQEKQQIRRISLSPNPIKVTLPNENVKEGKKWQTTPLDVACEISKNSANNALIAEVNGVLCDMTRPLEKDFQL